MTAARAEWSGTTFWSAWQRAVAVRPSAVFLVFEGLDGDVTQWTYGEFDDVVTTAASALHSHGVRVGSSVHIVLSNTPTFVAVWLASMGLGAWIVPSDPMGSADELAGHVHRTRPAVGLCAIDRADVYRRAVASSGVPVTVVAIDEAAAAVAIPAAHLAVANPFDGAAPGDSDRAAVMFTSGTTGCPKGVEITQGNYAFAGATMAAAADLRPGDRQLVVLPMFHANAQYYSVASAVWAGASVALMATFSASGFLAQAARHRATHASLFAAPIRMILARGATPVDGISLRHCWYAMNIADDQYEVLSSLLGCRPRQLYGMTETIPAVLTDHATDPVACSMGFVTPGCEVDVQRADGSSAEPDEVGEIVVRGIAGATLFAGYLDDPATTTESYRDGWFLTGDRARRTAEGRFFFDGRRADVLKVAGENVSTVEVEQVLCAHPLVLEAAVVGAPDPIRDEVPVAFVVATDASSPPSIEDLHAWCHARLGKAKRPRTITLLDELPRTSVGKIRKFLLRHPDAESGPLADTERNEAHV